MIDTSELSESKGKTIGEIKGVAANSLLDSEVTNDGK